jgi:hypothetical protein
VVRHGNGVAGAPPLAAHGEDLQAVASASHEEALLRVWFIESIGGYEIANQDVSEFARDRYCAWH